MQKSSVSTLQVLLVLLGSTGLLNHVILIPILLQVVGRDSWVSVLIATILALLWLPILYLIVKRTAQHHLFDWLRQKYGRTLSGTLRYVVVLYLLVVSVVTLKDTLTWAKTAYLTQTPTIALLILFVLLCYANSHYGIQSIATMGGILVPFVILFGFFVMTGNMHLKDYRQLQPLLEHGWGNVAKGVLYGGVGFAEIIYLVFLQQHLRNPIRFRTLAIMLVMYTGLTLGPLVGAIAEFGPYEAAAQRYPAYEEWRLLYIGRYIEHLDFLSIYQWLTGAFLRVSLAMYLIPEVLSIPKSRARSIVLIGAYVVVCGVVMWPVSDMKFLALLIQVGIPASTMLLVTVSLIVGLLVLMRRKQKGGGRNGRTATPKRN
ncbi:GerAB/ArcD/ProY family transporter [Tumebacillus permanentifrigoris]|uniref:Spore germination protein (Amino acid permease) n=1 Tax=Tumebacillus permanentifrigoris TaxID=378543 RepID=A0A316DD71_9BACL|nr:endospore germination permease [Tumebacillus permanentifrigoris]PWK13408.1 spore germination protein (amino acid permease) [Tumebacillus permanentifrigoris]